MMVNRVWDFLGWVGWKIASWCKMRLAMMLGKRVNFMGSGKSVGPWVSGPTYLWRGVYYVVGCR